MSHDEPKSRDGGSIIPSLSDEQRMLLQLLADGEINQTLIDKKQRAALDQIFIRICRKLNAKNRNHAVMIAVKNSLIDAPKSPKP